MSLLSWSFSDGIYYLIKYLSAVLLFKQFEGALVNTFQPNSCSVLFIKYFGSSDFHLTVRVH